MTPTLAHGGSAGLAAELFLLSLPVLGFGALWWWNCRIGRSQPGEPEGAKAEASSGTATSAPPEKRLEVFGRWMEESGRMRSTVARRLSTLASVYRYCEQEHLVHENPAHTSVGRRSTTSPALWAWTATSSAPSSSRPPSARLPTPRSRRFWP